jgi:hypothetical protein
VFDKLAESNAPIVNFIMNENNYNMSYYLVYTLLGQHLLVPSLILKQISKSAL